MGHTGFWKVTCPSSAGPNHLRLTIATALHESDARAIAAAHELREAVAHALGYLQRLDPDPTGSGHVKSRLEYILAHSGKLP